ncbi:hypothetical protein P154DRAFT_565495 [Amniculicola lignicola CBS 123094]|uniref:Uncharacterized protein n=1 Tax=Amniculicola lignicola CBS 123094 TaxID=1392246 RepID=A0A6A5WB11_9PLEO|nr:hypothetical protein P154DRAFT_565495 [Amniculicola lignicola CBS 123094]
MDVTSVISALPTDNWNARCIEHLPIQEDANFTEGLIQLVNAEGKAMTVFTRETWGVSIKNCYQYCNMKNVPYSFNFQLFASAFSNFLLPWLALTAQLPYETSTPWDNLISLCLSVGSPTLITYSLTLTILNRYSLQTRWHILHQSAQSRAIHDKYNDLGNRVKNIQYLLQEAQQVPLRASQERGWLSSLIVSPKNGAWWRNVQRRLSRTRRGVTFSLVAQILAAGVAWLFTVSSAFVESRGDRVIANQLSSGSLWLWLIPVIWGWVMVGTQNLSDSIDEALRADIAYRAREPPINSETSVTDKGEQKGIVVRSGLAVQPHRIQTNQAAFDVPPVTNLELPGWLGADIMGDEKREGPVFNYARVFTWWQLAQTVEGTLTATLNNIATGQACKPSREKSVPTLWNSDKRPEENLAGDSYTTAQYCGLDASQIHAYPEWSEITADVWKRIFVASIVGIFVQWGTTGPGILIAYHTPTKGVGCRTAGYLFYGGLATLVWILLATSMMFSHAAMLLYQREHRQAPSMDFRRPSNTPVPSPGLQSQIPQGYERTRKNSLLCGLAVTTRLLGKTIAVLNAVWLVLSSLLEYTGVYDRCYCKGNQTGLGLNGGWLVLFKTDNDLAEYATSPWAGGVAMSIMVCFAAYFFFWLGSRKGSREE